VLPHSSRDYLHSISYKNKKISKNKMTTIKVRKKIKITVNGYPIGTNYVSTVATFAEKRRLPVELKIEK
jgi:hypothetical protein